MTKFICTWCSYGKPRSLDQFKCYLVVRHS
jgi:hypothetical protein